MAPRVPPGLQCWGTRIRRVQSLPSGCGGAHVSPKRQAARSRPQAWWSPPPRGTQARARDPTDRGHHPWSSALWQIAGRNARKRSRPHGKMAHSGAVSARARGHLCYRNPLPRPLPAVRKERRISRKGALGRCRAGGMFEGGPCGPGRSLGQIPMYPLGTVCPRPDLAVCAELRSVRVCLHRHPSLPAITRPRWREECKKCCGSFQ